MRTVGACAAVAMLVAVVSLPPTAGASFPGRNGSIWYVHHVVDLGAETGPRGFDSEVLESFAPKQDRVSPLFGCPPGCHDATPSVSPDGESVVFGRGGNQIWVARADGSGLRRLPLSGWLPQWSPSGKRLVYGRGMFGAGRLYTVRLDGTRQRRLTAGHGDGNPVWSTTGLIAFQRGISNRDGQGLFVIRANGRGLRRLTPGGGGSPDWSPDGKRVAFVRDNDIYVIDADGRHLRRLTHGRIGVDPAWSPDGRWIAFSHGGLYVVRANGHGLRRLMTLPPTEIPDVEAFSDGTDWQALPPFR